MGSNPTPAAKTRPGFASVVIGNNVSEVWKRGQALPTATLLLWCVVVVIVVGWVVLLLVGATTT